MRTSRAMWPAAPVIVVDGRGQPLPEQGGFFEDMGHAVSDVGKAVTKTVSDVGHAITHPDEAVKAIGQEVDRMVHHPEELLKVVENVAFPGWIGAASALADAVNRSTGLGLPSATDIFKPLNKAIVSGDPKAIAAATGSLVQTIGDIASFVPGAGTALSEALGAAGALLQGGSPLKIAIEALIDAPPLSALPPPIKDILRAGRDAVLEMVEGKSAQDAVADILLAKARDALMARVPLPFKDLARTFFDAMVALLIHKKPIQAVAADAVGQIAGKLAGQAFAHSTLVPSISLGLPGGVTDAASIIAQHANAALRFADKAKAALHAKDIFASLGVPPPIDQVKALAKYATPPAGRGSRGLFDVNGLFQGV